MKTCLIVTGGSLNQEFAGQFLKTRSYDYVIAADRGLNTLKDLDITPNEIVGDLDSVDPSVMKDYRNNPAVKLEIHKPEKDETDTELAFIQAEKQGCTCIDLLGALGGRIDHALGNIQLLYPYHKRGIRIRIYDERNKLYLIAGETHFRPENLYGAYISFLPLTEKVEGLTLQGFKYPLTDRQVLLGTSLCISNELIAEEGIATVKSGTLICVESHD